MISKRIAGRKDGKSSATSALRYGEGLTPDRETGLILDKSHRTRLGNFGLVDDGVYEGHNVSEMSDLINMAAFEMQSNCDMNTRVGVDKKLAHFVVSYNQTKPSEAVLRDTEDSMLSAMALDENHFATFLHNDNGYWHLHIFASRIEKGNSHRGNPLWHDQINRDKVCRDVETRHTLQRDNGLHKIDEHGQLVEIPRDERRAKRDLNPLGISDRARTTEIYSGEKSFQTWVEEIRLGDRLKHAKGWQDLHAAAAAYGCEIKVKSGGYVILPVGEKGGIQLSKIGLKNLPAKFGAFQNAEPGQQAQAETAYKPAPTQAKAASHYNQWSVAKDTFNPIKTAQINDQRELHKQIRKDLQAQHKADLEKIRAGTKGQERYVAVSVAKMEHAIALATLADQLAHHRQALRKQFAEQGPGNTFRDYIVKEATKGDENALAIAQKYGVDDSTNVSRQREANQLKIVAAVTGLEDRAVRRLQFSHRVERSGTVIFNLGQGRIVTDSITSKQVQLNNLAASSPEAIATALRFATAKFGNTLTLTGSPEFQRLAVETAVYKKIGIKFADPALETYRKTLMEKQNALSHRNQPARAIPPAHLRSRLLDLSDGDLVLNIVGNELPLQQDVPSGMDKQQTKQNPDLQRTDRRAGGVGGTGSSGDTRTDLPTAGDVDHHLTPTITPTITPTPSTRPYQAIDRPGGNRDRADGNLTEIPSERIGLHANTEGLDTSIQPSKPIKLENGDELTEEAIQIDTEAPMIALNSEHVDPVEAWKREHPEMLETKLLTGTGKVLHIFADGQWIQNINRGREFSLQPRSNIEIKVGQKVEVAEDGSVKLISGQEKV